MEETEIEIEARENGKDSNRRYAYVCEGQTDEDRLKKCGCLFVVTTGGKYIRSPILEFLKEVSKVRDLVLVTDPDGPGSDIARRVQKEVGPCLRALPEKQKAIKDGKVGIAQMSMEDLKELLRPFIRHDLFSDENLSLEEDDLLDLGLIGPGSKARRDRIVDRYHLPLTSGKNVLDELEMLSVGPAEIKEILENE